MTKWPKDPNGQAGQTAREPDSSNGKIAKWPNGPNFQVVNDQKPNDHIIGQYSQMVQGSEWPNRQNGPVEQTVK